MISARVSRYALKAGTATCLDLLGLTLLTQASHLILRLIASITCGKWKEKQHFSKSELNILNIMYFFKTNFTNAISFQKVI